MSGVCGWMGDVREGGADVLHAMASRFAWKAGGGGARFLGSTFALAAVGPAGTSAIAAAGPIHVAVQGHPHWCNGPPRPEGIDAFCARAVDEYRGRGQAMLADIGGDFAIAVVDEHRQALILAVDRIGVRNVVYQQAGEAVLFGASSDVLNAHPQARRDISRQALYDYVYFHMVPGPATVFSEQRRVPPGHCAHFAAGRETVEPYWTLRFSEDRRASVAALAPAFRDALRAGVAAYSGGRETGTFLSGGTDSSTLAGTLGEVSQEPVRTYSIGFGAEGYDEMEYARIAARHFATVHHEHYVTPAEVVAAIPVIASACDQPFGNASVIPTYCCARFARADGIELLLGGDGGDELFGGNSRYAKQQQLAIFSRLPHAVQAGLEALLLQGQGEPKIALVRKMRSYVEQARLPMPARYETYNLLERLGPQNVFNADFMASVDRNRPQVELARTYGATRAQSLINRMLALDIKITLADNDLPKVTRACEAAGVDVAFPLLHEAVVDFSAALPPDFKLRGTRLRYFFKEALRDFLPPEILAKEKHGFGLPAGPWLRDYAPLNELAQDSIASLRKRGIFRAELLDGLLGKLLREHPGYYGTLAWVLMMLELWYQSHVED
ncbi:MAG: asparagine synthase-related protein [Casimicrobiaceae bacterium]